MTTEERILARIDILTQAKASAERQIELLNVAIGELSEMLKPELSTEPEVEGISV